MFPLLLELTRFRKNLRFSPDTAFPWSKVDPPSSGHCAVVSLLLHLKYNAPMCSTYLDVDGEQVSHWFNTMIWHGRTFDVDLTADQFGEDRILVKPATTLYPEYRVRTLSEINDETLQRAKTLAERSGLEALFQ